MPQSKGFVLHFTQKAIINVNKLMLLINSSQNECDRTGNLTRCELWSNVIGDNLSVYLLWKEELMYN